MKEKHYPDFRTLLIRVSKSDQQAFSTLYDFFSADLTRHILTKVSKLEVAEDILHDLFLALWRNREKMSEIEYLPGYLYSSCRYLILAYFRQELKKGNPLDLESLEILDESVSLEDRLHNRYIIDMISIEIEALPTKCKEVFKLSRSEYLSNQEIASQLNISVSTVEKHINKAISKLRSITKKVLFFF